MKNVRTITKWQYKVIRNKTWHYYVDKLFIEIGFTDPAAAEELPKVKKSKRVREIFESYQEGYAQLGIATDQGPWQQRFKEETFDKKVTFKAIVRETFLEPECFGNPEEHNPEELACKECPWFDNCAMDYKGK